MLRKMKSIYLESSVVSYLAARPSRDLVVAGNQQVTRDWWETRRGECELFVSEVVVAECAAGDPNRRLRAEGISCWPAGAHDNGGGGSSGGCVALCYGVAPEGCT